MHNIITEDYELTEIKMQKYSLDINLLLTDLCNINGVNLKFSISRAFANEEKDKTKSIPYEDI